MDNSTNNNNNNTMANDDKASTETEITTITAKIELKTNEEKQTNPILKNNKFNIEINPASLDIPLTGIVPTSTATPDTKHQSSDDNNNNLTITDTEAPPPPPPVATTANFVLPLEEGYATRQMDEYFRQTIAAIKEELHKKLESTQQQYTANDTDLSESQQKILNTDELNCIDCYLNSYCKLHHHQRASHTQPNECIKKSSLNSILLMFLFLNHFLIDGFYFNILNLLSLIQVTFTNASNATIIATRSSGTTMAMATVTYGPNYVVYLLPFILFTFFYLITCPFTIYLCKFYGLRRVAVCGSFITFFAIFISSFIKFNFMLFLLFFSVFNAIGMNMIYIPTILILSEFPYKKRLLSNTFILCGTGIGICIYPLVCNYILRRFNFFDTLFILAAVQFNCLICSVLIKTNKDYHGHRVPHQHHHRHHNQQQHPESQPQPHVKHVRLNPRPVNNKNSDKFDTESTNSSSIANFTIKQHWRRFCQTRKLNSKKTKKNLFHLIAEEKRKSKAASKVSLEDGFVITTSNNLLAPTETVSRKIIAHQNSTLHHEKDHSHHHHHHHRSLLGRIAHSLRSLTHHHSNHLSSNSSSLNDKYQQISNANEVSAVESPQVQAIQLQQQQSKPDESVNSTKPVEVAVVVVPVEPPPPSSLVTPFIVPIDLLTPTVTATATATAIQPPPPQSQLDLIQEDEIDDEDDDDIVRSYLKNGSNTNAKPDDSSTSTQFKPSSDNVPEDFTSVTSKSSRYLSYRNSLVNSIKGSLIECSVPEDQEDEEEDEEDEIEDDEDSDTSRFSKNDKNTSNSRKPHSKRLKILDTFLHHTGSNHNVTTSDIHHHHNPHHHHPSHHGTGGGGGSTSTHNDNSTHTTASTHNNNNNATSNHYLHLQRLKLINQLCVVDTSSSFNFSLNTKNLLFNLNNSLVKINKKQQKNTSNQALTNVNANETDLNLRIYFKYLFNKTVFTTIWILFINMAFSIGSLGTLIPVVCLLDYFKEKTFNDKYVIYILSVLGACTVIGRITATIVYKTNDETAKNRIFAHNTTLILLGVTIFIGTLCNTYFTIILFAIAYGCFLGFNQCLRSSFVHDIVGLDWNDDSLYCVIILGQSIGAFFGLVSTGILYNLTRNFAIIYYFAAILTVGSGILSILCSKFINFCLYSYRSLNKIYIRKIY